MDTLSSPWRPGDNSQIHGDPPWGNLCDIADAAMGMALAGTLAPDKSFATIELKINFYRRVCEARLRAERRVVRRGNTIGYVECEIMDEGGRAIAKASSTCIALRGERAGDANLHSHWLLRRKSHFCFEEAVEMGLHVAQRLLSSFEAVKHDCTLEARNDESRDLFCFKSLGEFPAP